MWRLAVAALILCAGCADHEDSLLEDSFLGDLYTRLNPAGPPPPQSYQASSPYFSNPTAPPPAASNKQ